MQNWHKKLTVFYKQIRYWLGTGYPRVLKRVD